MAGSRKTRADAGGALAAVSAAAERRQEAVEERKERRSSDMERDVMGDLHDVVCGRVNAWVSVKMASRAVKWKDFIIRRLFIDGVVRGCALALLFEILCHAQSSEPMKASASLFCVMCDRVAQEEATAIGSTTYVAKSR